jgi:hypothetical protein
MKISTTQVLIHLPDELVRRFKRHISVRQRSRFIQRLLEDALPPEDGAMTIPCFRPRSPSRKNTSWHQKWPSGRLPRSRTALAMARTPVSEPWRRSSARDSPGRYLVGQSRSGSGRRDPQNAPGCRGDGERAQSRPTDRCHRAAVNRATTKAADRGADPLGRAERRCRL